MQVIRASLAGFCMGVSLALRKLENAIAKNNSNKKNLRICTLGPIIHNPQVLAKFKALGTVCLNDLSEIKSADHVLIRAHGIPIEEEQFLKENVRVVEDATCPRVKNAQLAILKETGDNLELLLFGERDHPEVKGLLSYAQTGAHVFQTWEEIENLPLDPLKHYVLASQTTQDLEIFTMIEKELRKTLPSLKVLNTICDATARRQKETMEISRQADFMVVAGGKESGNTRRLASIAAEANIPVFHIETIEDLAKEQLKAFSIAGLTAGASTPCELINEIEEYILQL